MRCVKWKFAFRLFSEIWGLQSHPQTELGNKTLKSAFLAASNCASASLVDDNISPLRTRRCLLLSQRRRRRLCPPAATQRRGATRAFGRSHTVSVRSSFVSFRLCFICHGRKPHERNDGVYIYRGAIVIESLSEAIWSKINQQNNSSRQR